MTKITEVLKLIYDIQEPRRDTLEGIYQPRFLHSNTSVPKGFSKLILASENDSLQPKNEAKVDAQPSMLMQMIPSNDESMQTDALITSEINHLTTNQKDDETTAAPKPSSFATTS